MKRRIVVIGGNAAGMTAASRTKRLDPELDVRILEAGPFISYSICGLPFWLAGEVGSHTELLRFTPETLARERGITAEIRTRVEEIQPARRRILVRRLEQDRVEAVPYDEAVIATGYRPIVPGIEGRDLTDIFTVSRLQDGIRLEAALAARRARRVAVIGGGYVGLMMAAALVRRGLQVEMFEAARHLLPHIDAQMAEIVETELERHGVQLHLETRVRRLAGSAGRFQAVEAGRRRYPADLALIDVGTAPNTELAVASGVPVGMSGAIQVDERGLTALPGVWAAGNCAQCRHLVTGRPCRSTLGTTAARQGRVVGENLAGRRSTFAGTLQTSIEEIFDLSIARTGLSLRQAQHAGLDASAVQIAGRDRAGYYPGNRPLHVRLVFESRSGRLLGGQMAGSRAGARRIDTLVASITARHTLSDLARLDLAYAPPHGTLWDPLAIAANVALRGL